MGSQNFAQTVAEGIHHGCGQLQMELGMRLQKQFKHLRQQIRAQAAKKSDAKGLWLLFTDPFHHFTSAVIKPMMKRR